MNLNSECFILCIVLVIAAQCTAETETDNTDALGKLHKYCGRNLVNVLTLVCDGMYNRPRNGLKKYVPTEVDLSKFRSKRSVVSAFQRSEIRNRRGAYDECCRKGCTLEEMVEYCGI